METQRISVITPSQTNAGVVIDPNSNAMCVYYAIFGDTLDPIKYVIIHEGKVLNPFQPLMQQGITDGSVITFQEQRKDEESINKHTRQLVKIPSQPTLSINNDEKCGGPLIRAYSLRNVEINKPNVIRRVGSDVPRKPHVHQIPTPLTHENLSHSAFFDIVLNKDQEAAPARSMSDSIFTVEEHQDYENQDLCDTDEEPRLPLQPIFDESENEEEDSEEDGRPEEETYANSIMREAFRINDTNFDKIDLSGNSSYIYQNILQSQEPQSPPIDDLVMTETIVPKTPQNISSDPLPIMWDTDTKDDQMYISFCYEEMERNRRLSIKEATQLANEHLESSWNW